MHVADLVLSLLWLLGANGYSAALMDAPLHMSLWIAHCTHHATDVRGFLCTPPVLKSRTPCLSTETPHSDMHAHACLYAQRARSVY